VSDDRAGHKLGEVLRAAREERGVDLARVERETKIRARYLAALETGDYRELPGAVYTKGFLRNYGAYLGLDAEYLVDLYRLESSTTGVERVSVQPPPRPITARRGRAFVLTPGAVVAAILTVLVIVFVAYFVREFVTFSGTPQMTILEPAGDLAAYRGQTYLVRGVTEPNATIRVSGAVENPSVTAGTDGHFEVELRLVPGSNVITLIANDPVTGRDSDPVSRTIVVVGEAASPTPSGVVELTSPADGADLSGPVAIRGSAAPGASITVAATLVAAAEPTFSIVDPRGVEVPLPATPPSPPDPLTLRADSGGAFDAALTLLPGSWEISVNDGSGEAVTRRVSVTAGPGLHGTLQVIGGISYLEVDEDGVPKQGISGRNANPDTVVELAADSRLRIRVGNAGAVTLAINGIDLGTMGGSGAVVEWRISLR
jgi:cytoskeleton protein RodZ